MTTQTEEKVRIEFDVPLKKVRDLLVTAFEGGSNYWMRYSNCKYPEHLKNEVVRSIDDLENYYPLSVMCVTTPDCSIDIHEFNDVGEITDTHKGVNMQTIKKGLSAYATKCPQGFSDFINGDTDITTADTLLQIALFGEVIYG